MSRAYPLLRLIPEAAGKLQHDHDRALAKLAKLEAEIAELERQVRTAYGPKALMHVRHATRQALKLTQLKREVAA